MILSSLQTAANAKFDRPAGSRPDRECAARAAATKPRTLRYSLRSRWRRSDLDVAGVGPACSAAQSLRVDLLMYLTQLSWFRRISVPVRLPLIWVKSLRCPRSRRSDCIASAWIQSRATSRRSWNIFFAQARYIRGHDDHLIGDTVHLSSSAMENPHAWRIAMAVDWYIVRRNP
ncbi:hypothetical protein H310_03754 [Aphanomyces invadans]|uniref:Uncharacterized protein n=1 Tax=Aphanomyces invadans TaxID=157072 RepID=A0A024UKM3_9STRA|nr:hypothetical protein H310_03754 [Aphanomyces invadans]ETW06178.1 hypothetical protein H310_03754 [Aphanomyces invadans]|eukprot:XP_008865955.1 hypothetical protein H310_03754 [Aphanomyces invadans]